MINVTQPSRAAHYFANAWPLGENAPRIRMALSPQWRHQTQSFKTRAEFIHGR
jgi:hypothetical protein